MLNGKNTVIRLMVGLVKKAWYMREPNSFRANVKVRLNWSNYATKTDLKNATGVDTLSFTKRVDLANLRSHVDKLDIDKLKNVPTNLSNVTSEKGKLNVDK